MRKSFGARPYLVPMPVLIIGTYDEKGMPNAMNAAWGCVTDYKEITISLAPHKTTDNILLNKDFTVSMATETMVTACDYVGIDSQKEVADKFEKAGFHAVKSEYVNAPLIAELPMALECRMKRYEDEILTAEIINVSADESILTDEKIDVLKLKPIIYDPTTSTYVGLGNRAGEAFKDGLKLR